MKRVASNIFFIIKYVATICPTQIVAYVITAILRSFQSVLGVWYLKFIVDMVASKTNDNILLMVIILLTLINIIISLVNNWLNLKIIPSNLKILNGKMQLAIINKSAEVDLECYDNTEFYNKMKMASQQAESRIQSVMESFSNILENILSIGSFTIIITSYEPIVFIIVIVSLVLSFFLNRQRIIQQHEYYEKQVPISRRIDYIKKIVSQRDSAKEIRIFEKFQLLLGRKYDKAVQEGVEILKSYANKFVELSVLQNIISYTSNSGILLYLCFQALIGTISVGNLVALVSGAQQLAAKINQISKILPELSEHSMYINNYREFMNYIPKIRNFKGTCMKAVPEKPTFEFRNVSFRYPDCNEEIIKNITFKIKPGEKVALVGRNGSGKSTIIKLITRLYDPIEGTMYINNIPYNKYDVNSIRNNIGLLFQDYQNYAISIAENILMREVEDAGNDKKIIDEALEFVGLKNKINGLKDGIYTDLTREFCETGGQFSGGEFQRLAIARIFTKESKLIILDEPSSSLDPISEKKLFDKMMELSKDKAVIMVSHRLSNLINFDKILFIENGFVKEQGSHAELMQRKGLYAEMFRVQSERYASIST